MQGVAMQQIAGLVATGSNCHAAGRNAAPLHHPPSSLKSQVARSCIRSCAATVSKATEPQPQQRVATRQAEAALSGCSCSAIFLYARRTCREDVARQNREGQGST